LARLLGALMAFRLYDTKSIGPLTLFTAVVNVKIGWNRATCLGAEGQERKTNCRRACPKDSEARGRLMQRHVEGNRQQTVIVSGKSGWSHVVYIHL